MCPFIEQNLKGCSDVLCLGNLDSAMELCADNFVACEVFAKNYAKLNSSFRELLRRKTSDLLKRTPLAR